MFIVYFEKETVSKIVFKVVKLSVTNFEKESVSKSIQWTLKVEQSLKYEEIIDVLKFLFDVP